MQLYILAGKEYAAENNIQQYEIIGFIDEADSVLWNKKYNDEGYCEIYTPYDDKFLSLLQKGNYVYRFDDDMFCKIKTVEIETDTENGNYIIANAKDMCTILANRIVRWQIVYSGTVGGFIEKVLTDNVVNPAQSNRKIDNFVIDDSNFSDFSEEIEVSSFTDDLLALIVKTCKTYNIGFRVALDIATRQIIFRLYRGKNKASTAAEEYVEFSPTFENIISTHYKTDDTNYKNIVYVGYKNDADGTELLSLFKGDTEPQGEEREEIYVDGTGTSRDISYEELQVMFPRMTKTSETGAEGKVTAKYYDGETVVAKSEGEGEDEKITVTDYTYLLLIRILGENVLAERVKTQNFSGTVDTNVSYIYKADYDIGDTVRVISEYGKAGDAQIIEVIESDDNENGYNVEPNFEFLN